MKDNFATRTGARGSGIAEADLTPKQGAREGRPVGFPRCTSQARFKPSDTFTESIRRPARKVVAGEAPIQKVTISQVGGRWQESALERYLIRYQIRPVFQSLVFPAAPGQFDTEFKRLPEAKQDRGAVAQIKGEWLHPVRKSGADAPLSIHPSHQAGELRPSGVQGAARRPYEPCLPSSPRWWGRPGHACGSGRSPRCRSSRTSGRSSG